MLGEQRRVYVHNAAGVCLDELGWYKQKEAGEYYKIDVTLLEHGDDGVGLNELCLGDNCALDAESICALNYIRLRIVGNDERYLGIAGTLEIVGNVLGI